MIWWRRWAAPQSLQVGFKFWLGTRTQQRTRQTGAKRVNVHGGSNVWKCWTNLQNFDQTLIGQSNRLTSSQPHPFPGTLTSCVLFFVADQPENCSKIPSRNSESHYIPSAQQHLGHNSFRQTGCTWSPLEDLFTIERLSSVWATDQHTRAGPMNGWLL